MVITGTKSLFDNKKTCMTDDPMYFLLKMMGVKHQNLLQLLKFIIIRLILLWIGSNILAFCIIIRRGELKQYAAMLALSLPGFTGSTASVSYIGDLPKLKMAYNYCWPINCCGEKIEKRILHSCKTITIYSVALMVISFVTHMAGVLPLLGDEVKIDPIALVTQQYIPEWSRLMGVSAYYAGSMLFSYGLAYPIIFGLYEVYQMHFQLELLNEHLSKISSDYDTLDNSYLENEGYQEVIRQRLRICVKHHINIIKLMTLYQDNVKYAMLFLPAGSVAPVAACYFIKNKISPPSNFRMLLVLVTSLAIATSLSIAGQKLNNSSSRLFNIACECPWVYWNKQNKQILLILLTASMKPLSFSTYAGVELNLRLLFMFLRWMYSLVTLLQ